MVKGKGRKRQRVGPKVDDGRICVVCGDGQTPQWRKVIWQGVEGDTCNKCGIAFNDYERRMKRDFSRKPTHLECAAWGHDRQTPSCSTSPVLPWTDVETAWALVRVSYSYSSTRPSTGGSLSSSSSSSSSTAFGTSSYPSTRSDSCQQPLPNVESGKAESAHKPTGLHVEVDSCDEGYPPDLGYSLNDPAYSPLDSTTGLLTPTSVSSFRPDVLFAPPPDHKTGEESAYQQW